MPVEIVVGVDESAEPEFIAKAKALDLSLTVIIDTETTGLNPANDEVLQVAVVDGNADVLLNTLVKPVHRRAWSKAESIHGISPEDVKDAPTLEQLAPLIHQCVDGKVVVGYNLPYDLDMLRAGGVDIDAPVGVDVMREYARINRGKWAKLVDAASHYGYSMKNAHDALADAKATGCVYFSMLHDKQYLAVCAAATANAESEPESKPDYEGMGKAIGCGVTAILWIVIILFIAIKSCTG